MAYVEIGDVYAYGGINNTKDEAILKACLARAVAYVERETNRTFEASADTTRYFDVGRHTHGRDLLFDGDCASISTITNGDGVVVASSEYVTMPRNSAPYRGVRLLHSAGKVWDYTTDPEGAVSVAGRWAYSTEAPDDIKQAVLQLTLWYYRQRTASVDMERPIRTGDGSLILPSRIPSGVLDTVEAYRSEVVHQ